ncbi:probable protein phosphatase 2C 55 isoform X1 [Tanacetum coccineum]
MTSRLGDSGVVVVRDGCTIFRSPTQQHNFDLTYQWQNRGNGNSPSFDKCSFSTLIFVHGYGFCYNQFVGVFDVVNRWLWCILVKFEDQTSTDGFHKHFNGRRLSSLESHAAERAACYYDTRFHDVQHQSSSESHGKPSLSLPKGKRKLDKSDIESKEKLDITYPGYGKQL